MRCPSCAEPFPPGSQTCPNCGTAVAHLEAASNFALGPEGQALIHGEKVPPPSAPPAPAAKPKAAPLNPKLMKQYTKEKANLDKMRAKGKMDPATHDAKMADLKSRFQIP